ncbi:hypothetical protein [Lacipirellula sp.]|uniref:hypothetical protein n=1 Tax=Lacipirellula sp. TaxID=2691419 RepID=UPI003D0E61BB
MSIKLKKLHDEFIDLYDDLCETIESYAFGKSIVYLSIAGSSILGSWPRKKEWDEQFGTGEDSSKLFRDVLEEYARQNQWVDEGYHIYKGRQTRRYRLPRT